MWLSRIIDLLAEPPAFLRLGTQEGSSDAFEGRYLAIKGAPFALGAFVARGDEALVYELISLRSGTCDHVIKICRHRPGTARYERWAVPRRVEYNPHSTLPAVELAPTLLVPVPGGVVKVQEYLSADPATSWRTPAPVRPVYDLIAAGDTTAALSMTEELLLEHGERAVLLEAKGLALTAADRLAEATAVLERALEAHVAAGTAGSLSTSCVLASVLRDLYRRDRSTGDTTLSFEFGGVTHTQTIFALPEDAATDDMLDDRPVLVLLEALADEPYFVRALELLVPMIEDTPFAIPALRAIRHGLEAIDPSSPVLPRLGEVDDLHSPEPQADDDMPVETPEGFADLHARFDTVYQPEPTRGQQARARYLAALEHLRTGGLDDAERDLRAAVALDPDTVDYVLELGRVLSGRESDDEAQAVLEEAARRFVDDSNAHEAVGDLHVHRDDLPQAKLAYLRALRTDPDEPWRLELKLAEVYDALHEDDRALALFRAAYEHGRDEPDAVVGLVQVLRRPAFADGDAEPAAHPGFVEAGAVLEDALERMPRSSALLVCDAQFKLAAGRIDDALSSLRLAVDLDPGHPIAGRFLGELEAWLADETSAESAP